MDDICVYVAFHNNNKLITTDGIYTGIQVGKEANMVDTKLITDNSGDHISGKNGIYSELTGWYWIWKNTKHAIIGTSHYRRFFTAKQAPLARTISKQLLFFIGLKKKRHGLFYVRNAEPWIDKILSKNEIATILCEYDAILPQKKKFKYSVAEQYKRRHKAEDLNLTRNIISEKHPAFLEAFDKVMAGKEMYSFNMFVMRHSLFNEYMEWLFDILFELEERSVIDYSDVYQKRVCAFMAERLQTVWFQKQSLKIKELPVIYLKKTKTTHY